MTENDIGTTVVDAAFQVHKYFGPGLFETVYEKSLACELRDRGLEVDTQVPVEIQYRDVIFDEGFRADLVVEDKVLVELKSVEELRPVHKKQTQTYLKLLDLRLGYLINFNESLLKEGITRCVNNLPE